MYVKVQILFKLLQFLIHGLKRCAGVFGWLIPVACSADLSDQLPGSIVFLHHRINRIPYGLEERWLDITLPTSRALQRVNVRKENLFFLLHVHQHLARDVPKQLLDLADFAMTASVFFTHFREHSPQPGNHVTHITVMALSNVALQLRKRGFVPTTLVRTGALSVLLQPIQYRLADTLARKQASSRDLPPPQQYSTPASTRIRLDSGLDSAISLTRVSGLKFIWHILPFIKLGLCGTGSQCDNLMARSSSGKERKNWEA